MKTFNIAVVAIWLVIFGVATTPTNNEMVDWHDNAVYEVNNLFANYVWVAPHNDKGEAIPFASSDTTQFYLRHTFTSLLFFIFALNISFYTGRGDIQQLVVVLLAGSTKRFGVSKFSSDTWSTNPRKIRKERERGHRQVSRAANSRATINHSPATM